MSVTAKDCRASERVMGSLNWGHRDGAYSKGRLTPLEHLTLVGNLVRTQLVELGDSVKDRLGLLAPVSSELEALLPVETGLVRDSLDFAVETHDARLLHHSWRTYLFGVLLGEYAGVPFDRELLFSAAILHDSGLINNRETHVHECCFAISGAEVACNHLSSCGHDADTVHRVGDAIALHLNAYVSARAHGGEAYLVNRGAMCDLFGAGHRRLAKSSVDEIMHKHPREGVIEALEFETARHLKGTRPYVLTKLTGGKAPKTAFDIYGV
ncbi:MULTISPECIES: HD domain-containing protein [unclassified Pseudovibrio]|uniref:HD domain-containing protein n=1 Tax=unclassified Pseudovibrio TaxID=2627060 RepID=UPI0007AEBC08|nr:MULTISPECIES: HD domain-containing protein [unclassified Pseudovibrio]KZL02839.1 HD domain protein [Pseudovibrio sp. W74]KZL07542.1 HD domain protein [Pseudovibrio sp. Ad14]